MSTDETRHETAGEIAIETIESLIQQLDNAGEWPEPRLLKAILARGTEAVEPLRVLVRRKDLKWPELAPTQFAVELLGSLGDPAAIPDLIDLFRHYDDEVLESAERALAAFGPQVLEPA